MASIRAEVVVAVKPEAVWEVIKDIGMVHRRLVPGLLTDARLDGPDARIVTFSNGLVVRERVVDINDALRRFAYTASGGSTTHHNASLQVFEDDKMHGSRIIWISDFLPNKAAPGIQQLVDSGSKIMKQTLEANAEIQA
jgi:carbon monoxide dehydrogenase subunit G